MVGWLNNTNPPLPPQPTNKKVDHFDKRKNVKEGRKNGWTKIYKVSKSRFCIGIFFDQLLSPKQESVLKTGTVFQDTYRFSVSKKLIFCSFFYVFSFFHLDI